MKNCGEVVIWAVDEKEPPQLPLNLGVPRTLTSRSELVLPPGWDATPPDNIHQQTPWVRYDRVYRVEHGTLIEERTIAILQSKVPVASWPEYKKFADIVSPGTYPYVQLTRSSASADSAGPPSPIKDDPEARRLVSEAAEANQHGQIDRAGDLIQQAKAINNEQPYLWSVAGYRAMRRGEVTEAVGDHSRELELHPNEGNIYPQLAGAQLAQGKRPQTEATLRRRLKTVGPDPNVATQLVQMLLEDGQTKDAVAIAEDASKADSDNKRLVWLLGRARMKDGQKAAGAATLLSALRETDDPGLRNDLAYELADADRVTQEVEDASRKAVEQLTAESANWTLTTADQDIREMRKRSNLLVASWDTLGWTIYKSASGREPGRLTEAKRYIAAAWRNSLTPEVGLHLGDLEEAQRHLQRPLWPTNWRGLRRRNSISAACISRQPQYSAISLLVLSVSERFNRKRLSKNRTKSLRADSSLTLGPLTVNRSSHPIVSWLQPAASRLRFRLKPPTETAQKPITLETSPVFAAPSPFHGYLPVLPRVYSVLLL